METDNASSKVTLKAPAKPLENAEEEIFFHILTPYAFSLVKDQLKESEKIEIESVTHDVGEITVNCKFKFAMCLPCKHIFSYRRKKCLAMFDKNMYHKRWKREYFYSNLTILRGEHILTNTTSVTAVIQPKQKVQITQEKFKRTVIITNKLASITAEQSKVNFDKRLELLENIYRLWSQGKDLDVVEITKVTSNLTNIDVISEENTNDEEITFPTIESSEENEVTYLNGTNKKLIKNIKMPMKVKMRGRPKGATVTTIGLRRRNNQSKIIPLKGKVT